MQVLNLEDGLCGMTAEFVTTRVRQWVNRCDAAVAALMPLHAPLKDLQGEPRHTRALMLLSTACLGTTGSALHLIEGMRLWDAERLMRSVVEGTAKFGYLLESPATLTMRCIEYRDTLPAIAKLRWHRHATEAIEALGTTPETELRAYRDLVLSEEEVEEIRATYPREVRRDIERRWGFTALVDAISRPGGAFGPTGRLLFHEYSAASHLHHMSYEGTEMPLERDHRPKERRESIELAHAAKLIDGCFRFTQLRALAIYRLLALDTEPLADIEARHGTLLSELDEASRNWERVEYGPVDAENEMEPVSPTE